MQRHIFNLVLRIGALVAPARRNVYLLRIRFAMMWMYVLKFDLKCELMYNVQWRPGSLIYSFWMTIADAAPPPLQIPAAPNSPDFNA